uniref:DUF547 domain-containing protein n=1 Tax=Ditylenchus dipsaci TaxID=166011 RepID=A0A915CNV7_9BILA
MSIERSPVATLKATFTKMEAVDENENQLGAASSNVGEPEWVPQEYDKLVHQMRKAGLIQDNPIGRSKILKNSFKGEDFVQWIMQKRKLRRGEALSAGQKVVERYFSTDSINSNFSSDRYYQLPEEDQSLPLNASTHVSSKNSCRRPTSSSVSEFNATLCTIIQPIFDQILSENRRCIYYDLLEENQGFQEYLFFIRNAAYLDVERASSLEKLAWFVNLHNMMVLHIIYKYGLATNIWQRRKYQNSLYYQIGKYTYSLQSIFNGILRGNKKGMDMLWEPFGAEDPRKEFSIKDGEPLVHFAINNCAQSCPPLKAYSTEKVFNEMKDNARNCIQSEDFLQIDRKKKLIALARLFKWYAWDFGNSQEDIIQWICDLFPDKLECKKSLMDMFLDGQYSISYLSTNSETNLIHGRNNK